MTLLQICIFCSFIIVLLGNIIYAWILLQRRFHKAKSYITQDAFKSYTEDLQRIIKKTNGWLYLVVFFNCINYSFGPWSIAFSMLCFLASTSGENNLVAFCSVFAAISASAQLFANPSQRHSVANQAWKQSQSELAEFVIEWQNGDNHEAFKVALKELSKKVSEISENTEI